MANGTANRKGTIALPGQVCSRMMATIYYLALKVSSHPTWAPIAGLLYSINWFLPSPRLATSQSYVRNPHRAEASVWHCNRPEGSRSGSGSLPAVTRREHGTGFGWPGHGHAGNSCGAEDMGRLCDVRRSRLFPGCREIVMPALLSGRRTAPSLSESPSCSEKQLRA